MKYKIGDKVRITKNFHGHGFDIGDIVIITYVGIDPECEVTEDNLSTKQWYKALDEKFLQQTGMNIYWFFDDFECEKALTTIGEKVKEGLDNNEKLAVFLCSNMSCENCPVKINGIENRNTESKKFYTCCEANLLSYLNQEFNSKEQIEFIN